MSGQENSEKSRIASFLTVGIVTFNRERYLAEAISSVLSQSIQPAEILVVNDGSSDNTKGIIAEVRSRGVRGINLTVNSGRPQARSTVVSELKTEYLVWLDDDDTLPPGALELFVREIRAHPEAEVIYGDYLHCDEQMRPLELRTHPVVPQNQMLMNMVFENIVSNNGVVIKRSLFERIGGYDSTFPRCQDYEFWVRALLSGAIFHHHRQNCCNVRKHQANQANPLHTKDQSKHQCAIIRMILEKAKLEEIMPVLDWQSNPQNSAAEALQIIAGVLFDHGDDETSLDCLNAALDFTNSPKVKLMRALVLRALSLYQESSDAFAQALGEMEPSFKKMNIKVGAPRGSALLAETFAQAKSKVVPSQ